MNNRGIVKVLSEKTLKKLNIDFLTLSDGSHKKIYVQCTRCNEEFLRERRNLKQLHSCPKQIIKSDGSKLQWCNKCKHFLNHSDFKDDLQYCSDCFKKIHTASSREEWLFNNEEALNTVYNGLKQARSLEFVDAPEIEVDFTDRIRIEYKLLDEFAKPLSKERSTDAGWDISSAESIILKHNSVTNVRTGLCVACPEKYYLTVEGRSSLYKKGIIPNRGIIDAGYTDQIYVMLYNVGDDYEIKIGDRIAQVIFHKVHDVDQINVPEFSSDYNIRGNNGFGSSGR